VSALKRSKTALVISPTHQAGEQATQAIREELRKAGKIGPDETPVTQLVSTNLTMAEKTDSRNYQAGQTIQFNQHAPGIPRGSRWEVTAIQDGQLNIRDERGFTRLLPLGNNPIFDVFQATTLGFSPGDSTRITRNGMDAERKRLDNGQLLEVMRVNPDGTILSRNKIIKAQYWLLHQFGHIAHAHRITSHAAQGKMVDAVFIAQPASTFAATNRNQFYVLVSRAKERVHVYTDDKDALLLQASEPGNRLSALELVKRKPAHVPVLDHLIRKRKKRPVTSKVKPQEPDLPVNKRQPAHAPRP